MSSLAPSDSPNIGQAVATSPSAGLPSPPAASPLDHTSSHSSSSSTEELEELEDEPSPAPLRPMSAFRAPKSLAERKNSNSTKASLGTTLARKRADSLKWSKYAGGGTFELNLGQDELRRTGA